MATTTTATQTAEQLDPWGFGSADPARSAAVEHTDQPSALATLAALEARDLDDAAVAFPPFAQRHAARPATQVRAGTREWLAVLAVFTVAVLGQAFYIGYRLSAPAADAQGASLVVSSHPAGWVVAVDGHVAGTTPLAVTAAPGRHHVAVTDADGAEQAFEVDVLAGERWTRHVEAADASALVARSALQIEALGGGAKVFVDGEFVGSAPIARLDVAPGAHVVRLVYAGGATSDRPRAVVAATRASTTVDASSRSEAARVTSPARPPAIVVTTPAPAAPRAAAVPTVSTGWVRVDAPFDVDVLVEGRLVGSSGVGAIALAPGGHALELVNDALGYRIVTKAVVQAGKSTTLPIEAPRAVVHINAQPWAEVLVDGRPLGDTPLANVMLPIGHHQLVFRHPELGERVQAFTVRAGGPNRVAADLRR